MDYPLSDVLNTALKAGKVMLENGAEVFRVEDTMKRITRSFGIENSDFFVLTNGLFASCGDKEENNYARVKYIPVKSANLSKVVLINQLSREIAQGKYTTLEEVNSKIDEIQNIGTKPLLLKIIATALSAGCFTILFNGALEDGFASLTSGILLGLFLHLIAAKHLSKILTNLIGGALVTVICLLFYSYGPSSNMNAMIAGAIIPLVPGIPFVNGIRDIGNGDYLSGAVRLLDAIFVFICIAVGVGVVLSIFQIIHGGLFL